MTTSERSIRSCCRDPGSDYRIWKKNYIMETDASLAAVRAILKQLLSDTSLEHPVAFISKAFMSTERKHSVNEREMLAVVRSVKHFRVTFLAQSSC